MYYVTLYLTNRAYGGPEEGGWWYSIGQRVRVFPCVTLRRAKRIQKTVDRIAQHRNKVERRRLPSSVLCNGWYDTMIEDKYPGEFYPEERPHYE